MSHSPSFLIFSGRSHRELGERIANCMGSSLGDLSFEDFPDGEIGVQINENVRGRDVFVVQSMARRPNFYLMELLILIDALKRASARSVVAVIPYFCYARQDRKEKGRVPITARLVADLLERAGVSRILTMDLHTEQIQGFFNIPVDNLYARPAFVEAICGKGIRDLTVVNPDIGSVKLGRAFASDLGADMAIINKRRLDAERVEANALIGEVADRDVLLVDDIYSTGGTLKKACGVCRSLGARKIYAAITHGLIIGDTLASTDVEKLFITDTVSFSREDLSEKIERVSVAPVFAKAMLCVIHDASISSMYQHCSPKVSV